MEKRYQIWREGTDKRVVWLTYSEVIQYRRKGWYVVRHD